jgi:elongation factor P--(R)-beta-lysine ligase
MDSHLRQRLARHAGFTRAVRSFFDDRGYIGVDTPSLAPFLIPEPSLEVFRTDFLAARGARRPLWLIPSPELWMKRLLAGGSGNIYQVSRSFRNGDAGSPHHNPEFSLLEWYTVGAGYMDSIAITEALFAHLLSHTRPCPEGERLAPPFHRISMADAFQRFAGITLERCLEPASLRDAGLQNGIPMPEEPSWEEAFHIAFLTRVEPALPRDKPVVLYDYPRLIPTTARGRDGTPWSERWELYVDGVEVANCYTEETDPDRLRALIAEEAERKRECRIAHAVDDGLAGLFPRGFPACSGAALGVDRLEMLFHGEKSLEGVILFPFSAILAGQSETKT